MPYILYTKILGLNYYLQCYYGEFRLNGLENNAKVYDTAKLAAASAKRMSDNVGHSLLIKPVKQNKILKK
jgi:hypothetical protein